MRLISLALATALLGGCALTAGDRPPTCDGKHRRPANPNGSVLLPAGSAAPQASAEGAVASTASPIPATRSCRS